VQYRRRRTRHHVASLGRPLCKTSDVFKRDLQFTTAIYPLGMASYMAHVHSIEQFFADADSGNLPSFCIVDPDFRSFSEESPQDIRKGESFAAEVISRVMHGPGWADTLLIWTYDEHGGYYDHVAPPAAVPPDDVPGRSLVAHPSLLRSLLKVLFPAMSGMPSSSSRARMPTTESACADPAGRGGNLATRRTGPDGSAGVPDAAGAARAGASVGHLVGRLPTGGRWQAARG